MNFFEDYGVIEWGLAVAIIILGILSVEGYNKIGVNREERSDLRIGVFGGLFPVVAVLLYVSVGKQLALGISPVFICLYLTFILLVTGNCFYTLMARTEKVCDPQLSRAGDQDLENNDSPDRLRP